VRIGIIIAIARGSHRTGLVVALAFASLAALLAPGCGSSTEPRLSATAASQLQRELSGVRAAAEDGDEAGALRALSSFSRLVSREARAGNLSAAQARGLRTGIAQARKRIEVEVVAPAPAPAPAPPTSPPPVPAPDPVPEPTPKEPEEEQEEKEDRGKSKGKGKGKGRAGEKD
jgi:hypothetical protein